MIGFKISFLKSNLRESKVLQKNSRIIILDSQHLRSLFIEKTLNHLGYYRIAIFSSFCELSNIMDYGDFFPIDLLIINNEFSEDFIEYIRLHH